MLDARCQPENGPAVTYSVFGFQALTEAEQESLRQSLFCPGCGAKAYFRRASSDGKQACFGSLYHADDCPEFRPSTGRTEAEQALRELAQALDESDALRLDFSAPVTEPVRRDSRQNEGQGTANQGAEAKPKGGATGTEASSSKLADAAAPKVAALGLGKILKSLLRGSELASSDLWVYTDEKYRWRAKNLFVNFADAEPNERGSPKMYWGTLSHADKAMAWLNPADCRDLGIPIDKFSAALLKRFGISDRAELEGAGIILFGKCFWNKDKTRKIIRLWNDNLSRILIIPSKD
ncbi:hypothetical protein [Shewanella sedimentimangrovi]|uniref:Uncharacterized protein n=1 Tax=Shewanella sedimentimangrovi TaxID=2814293 RepID=A0ABX7R0T6_9GAMM|nr:hypothetical protein [Shewanella sedimentimangrovi]QSX36485.1 hypothetical protein JYB85_14510 [Shewanella sedimentimangrovi]